LHDQEVGVVDVELYRLEEILNSLLLRPVAIDEVFGGAAEDNLPCYGYLCVLLKADWRL
jgi:hypothetical protein